jgi:predicted nucleic acid-binding protein
MIVADTGAILGLLDRSDKHHRALADLFDQSSDDWVLPWAILPEVDYLVGAHLGERAQLTWISDLADGAFHVDRGSARDLHRARQIAQQYRGLRLGLVDAIVIATAERLKAEAIATLDLRHFGAVRITGAPQLVPGTGKRNS